MLPDASLGTLKSPLPIIETHFHLDYLKNCPADEIIFHSHQMGVKKLITIAVEPGNLDRVIQLSQSYEQVYCTQGIHPHEASHWNSEIKDQIISNLKAHKKVVAIGETGLDYYYNKSPPQQQIEVFKQQLQLAVDFDLPVVIHTRDAEEDTAKILFQYSDKLKKKGVLHSFTSHADLAAKALDLGFYLGFNGIITFKNAENVRQVVKECPLERMLVETDAPFLSPTPFRGRENAPYLLPFVIQKIAEIKEIDCLTVLQAVYQNSLSLFDKLSS